MVMKLPAWLSNRMQEIKELIDVSATFSDFDSEIAKIRNDLIKDYQVLLRHAMMIRSWKIGIEGLIA